MTFLQVKETTAWVFLTILKKSTLGHLKTQDEWLSEIRELVESSWQFIEPNLLAENEDVLVFNHIVVDDGQKFRVTAVNFLKDGQTWRLSTHRTLIKD